MAIDLNRFLYLDIETGGLDPTRSPLLSYYFSRGPQNVGYLDQYERYVRPPVGSVISSFSRETIIPQLREKSLISEKEAISRITGVLQESRGNILTGWNIGNFTDYGGFDIPFLLARTDRYTSRQAILEAGRGLRVWDVGRSYQRLAARAFRGTSYKKGLGPSKGEYRSFMEKWGAFAAGNERVHTPGWKLETTHRLWGQEFERVGIYPKGWTESRWKLIEELGGAHRAGIDIEILTKDMAEMILHHKAEMNQIIREDPAGFRRRLFKMYQATKGSRIAEATEQVTKEFLEREGLAPKFAERLRVGGYGKWALLGSLAIGAVYFATRFSGFDDDYNTIEGLPHGGVSSSTRPFYGFGSGWRGLPSYLMGQRIDPRILAYRKEVWDIGAKRREVEEYISEQQASHQALLGQLNNEEMIAYGHHLVRAINEKNKALRIVRLNQFIVNVEDADTLILRRRGIWNQIKSWFGRGEIYIRLAGIDAPEVAQHKGDPLSLIRIWENQPGGKEATLALNRMIAQHGVDNLALVIDPTRKTYGRYLGVIGDLATRENLNLQLVQMGAVSALPFGKPEWDILSRRAAKRAETEAFQANRGMWQYARYKAIHIANQYIGRPITHNVLTRLDKLARNLNLGAYASFLASLGTEVGELTPYEAQLAAHMGKVLRKTHGPPPRHHNTRRGNTFSGFDDAYNTIQGLFEGGMAAHMRKRRTDFGSGFDPIKQMAKQLGRSVESILKDPEFLKAVEAGSIAERLGKGYFGEVFKGRAVYKGIRFPFVKKTIFSRRGALGVESLRREVSAMVNLIGEPFVPTIYGWDLGQRVLYMEHLNLMPVDALAQKVSRKTYLRTYNEVLANIDKINRRYKLINADIHRGNIMIEKGSLRPIWLDWGLTVKSTAPEAKKLIPRQYTGAFDVFYNEKIGAKTSQLHKLLAYDEEDISGQALAAMLRRYGLKFSGFDDAYNVIEGLPERGFAGFNRKLNTDFGSGWRAKGVSLLLATTMATGSAVAPQTKSFSVMSKPVQVTTTHTVKAAERWLYAEGAFSHDMTGGKLAINANLRIGTNWDELVRKIRAWGAKRRGAKNVVLNVHGIGGTGYAIERAVKGHVHYMDVASAAWLSKQLPPTEGYKVFMSACNAVSGLQTYKGFNKKLLNKYAKRYGYEITRLRHAKDLGYRNLYTIRAGGENIASMMFGEIDNPVLYAAITRGETKLFTNKPPSSFIHSSKKWFDLIGKGLDWAWGDKLREEAEKILESRQVIIEHYMRKGHPVHYRVPAEGETNYLLGDKNLNKEWGHWIGASTDDIVEEISRRTRSRLGEDPFLALWGEKPQLLKQTRRERKVVSDAVSHRMAAGKAAPAPSQQRTVVATKARRIAPRRPVVSRRAPVRQTAASVAATPPPPPAPGKTITTPIEPVKSTLKKPAARPPVVETPAAAYTPSSAPISDQVSTTSRVIEQEVKPVKEIVEETAQHAAAAETKSAAKTIKEVAPHGEMGVAIAGATALLFLAGRSRWDHYRPHDSGLNRKGNRFSGFDDAYNTIRGFAERGFASFNRKQNTDFGSGLKRIMTSVLGEGEATRLLRGIWKGEDVGEEIWQALRKWQKQQGIGLTRHNPSKGWFSLAPPSIQTWLEKSLIITEPGWGKTWVGFATEMTRHQKKLYLRTLFAHELLEHEHALFYGIPKSTKGLFLGHASKSIVQDEMRIARAFGSDIAARITQMRYMTGVGFIDTFRIGEAAEAIGRDKKIALERASTFKNQEEQFRISDAWNRLLTKGPQRYSGTEGGFEQLVLDRTYGLLRRAWDYTAGEMHRIPGFDDAYNTIQGLSEKGIAAKLRKQNTDFGSGFDPVKQMAKQLDVGIEKLLGSKSFQTALYDALKSQPLQTWEGGYGVAYLREATFAGETFKFIEKIPHAKHNTMSAAQFAINREAEMLAKLGGEKGFPTLYNVEQDQRLLMEYIEGETLFDYFNRGGAWSNAQQIELLKVGKRAMEKGAWNYDIKVDNFILSKHGEIVWIDWGAAAPTHNYWQKRFSTSSVRTKLESKQEIYKRLVSMPYVTDSTEAITFGGAKISDPAGVHGMGRTSEYIKAMRGYGPFGSISVTRLEEVLKPPPLPPPIPVMNQPATPPPLPHDAIVQNTLKKRQKAVAMAQMQKDTQRKIFESANGSRRTKPGGRRHTH